MQVIVWMLEVTDSILAFCNVDGSVRQHLDVLSVQQTVFLLGYHVGNPGLAGIEVVSHLFHGVLGAAFFHLRLAFDFPRQRVKCSLGIDGSSLHVIFHVVCGKFHVAVLHGHVPIVIYLSLAI